MSFEELYGLETATVTVRPALGSVGHVNIGPETFYIKKYQSPGKKKLRFLFKSKARREFENQLLFRRLGINTPEIVLFRERGLIRRRAVLVTREIPRAATLLELLSAPPSARPVVDFNGLTEKLADIVRRIHDSGFVHNDLRMRNILVQNGRLFLIDSPNGMVLRHVPFFLQHRKIKDLALLFEDARRVCSAPRMLRFFLLYARADRLEEKHKKIIRRILSYYG
jgi:serine/threonine-protein kinase RIO1